MDRRRFLQTVAATTAAITTLPSSGEGAELPWSPPAATPGEPKMLAPQDLGVEGHTRLCRFSRQGDTWTVYEDLRTRDSDISFVTSSGSGYRLRKSAEAAFADKGPQHLGLDLKMIGLAGPDLLADKLLAGGGDPDEEQVRRAAPPMNSAPPPPNDPNFRPRWDTIVGTRECADTMPVYPSGSTRTYHPVQYFKEISGPLVANRYDGLVGGWMPAPRKVFPAAGGGFFEVIVFGDVLATNRFIVQTWHRTTHIVDGKVVRVEFGYSYPSYTRRRQPPTAEQFYRGLLDFAEYWERQTADVVPLTLPDRSWADMVRYAFAKEQIVRPNGVYPKYGAVDRDYYGPEYDGFQDIFTMSLTANLELGRFTMAHDVFDNYFSDFTDAQGLINMRGPETAQFGLTLWLIARYYAYTRDASLILKHRAKIEQTASLLMELQNEALRLPKTDRGYGLIAGWNESDSCLNPDPAIWNKPYFANSAMTVRGWREIARLWRALGLSGPDALATDWEQRAQRLQTLLQASVERNTRTDMRPPYLGPLPGTTLTFRESLEREQPSEQGWPHRAYTELVHADVLPEATANMVIDCMRAYGATTLGVVANVGRPQPDDREILGFISYGYAQQLLRLDRIPEYILFLFAHRYHDHSRGSWTAGEVSGIAGDEALFCIPAQQTIPVLVKWALVFEEPDRSVLHLGRALPEAWIATEQPIAIQQAPTRWGRVDYSLHLQGHRALVRIRLADGPAPSEVHVRFRLPGTRALGTVSVNEVPAQWTGVKNDTLVLQPGQARHFEVAAQVS